MSELFKYSDTLSGVRMRAKHIAEEQHNIEGYIHVHSVHLKAQCQKFEGLIAKELKRSL